MAKGKPPAADPALRRRAEERLGQRGVAPSPRRAVDTLRLLHELEVHQVELEVQNEELRASRLEAERLATLYGEFHDFAPVGYASLSPDGTIRTANLAAASLMGAERSRVVGKRLGAFVLERDRGTLNAFLARVGERGGNDRASCELAFSLDGKALVQVHLTAAVITRPKPEILLCLEDVTEQRKREEEIKEALRLLNASQRVAALGTFTVEIAIGRWTSSTALDEILGIDGGYARSLAGFVALVSREDRPPIESYLATGLRRGEALDQEFRVVNATSGEERWVWARGEVEHDATGPTRLVGTIQDITERKRLRQERAELLRAAEAARALAEEANHAKDAFMATLSHELRNPLTPISNGLFILERSEPGSERAKNAVRVIDRQVQHLARLVDDLLDSTRIARGKVQLRRRRFDLNELVRDTVDDYRSQFDLNGVRLELEPAASPLFVHADWDRLAQVVGNLLQNAAKFCERDGTTRVAVGGNSYEPYAVVRVTDDGVGMAPEVLSRLFQPFMQGDTTLARSKGGLGLGMAVAKRLVELHGGQIFAHSAGKKKGTEFTVRIPLAPEAAITAGPPHAVSEALLAHRRVLIIEDNVDAADTLRELLRLHLQEVKVAHSGPEGLAMAREFHPQIVLCDIGLPGMDGYEVARAIRSDGALDGTYLVALSGYALPEDVRRATESGFHRHLAKPPSLEDLDRIIAEVSAPSALVQPAPNPSA